MSDLGDVMEVVTVPQVQIGGDALPPANGKGFSGDWKNMSQDLANIAAEISAKQPQVQDTTPIMEPVQPQDKPTDQAIAAPATPETAKVPDKFLKSDGTVDQDRLLRSYVEAEKALKRAQNKPDQAYQPEPTTAVPGSFEAEIETDLQKLGAGKTLAKLFNAARQAGYQDARAEIGSFVERFEDYARTTELRAIGERDPWVFTDQGFNTLKSIREGNPWLNASPEPWKTAYLLAKGQGVISTSPTSQVQTPTPKAVTAPPAPVTAADRTAPQTLKINDPNQLKTYLANLTPDQEKAFWSKFGLRF